ncbi:hypothetical protein [Halopenitus persicus]|uniref:Uncharacterized protein n=1 Tax=Halopenitus persicus TaxID=1048396 RepID=A0A1H3KTR7_9EURY|nr:hypothetical protein [Halopenitus persicus]SDY55054.1 hypothetical protein SAMN05216564_106136 [Halopenitus persicus]
MFDELTRRPSSVVSRRSLLAGTAGVLGASAAGGALLTAGSTTASAAIDGDPAALEAGDTPTVVSNDGRIESVYLTPAIDVEWADFGSGVRTIDVTVAVGNDAGVDTIVEETLTTATDTPGPIAEATPVDGTSGFADVAGALSLTLERLDATAIGDAVTSDALSDATLQAGETAATVLDVVLRADLAGHEGESETVLRTTSFEVTVRNPEGSADAGGTANTEAV